MRLPASVKNSIVLDHRYWTGTLRDYSPHGNHGTATTGVQWKKEKKRYGLYFPAGAVNQVTVTHDASLDIVDGTILAYWPAWWESFGGTSGIVHKGAAWNFWRDGSADITYLTTGNISRMVHTVNEFKATTSLCVTWENGGLPSLYRDGAFHGDAYDNVANVTTNASDITIGYYSTPLQRIMDGLIILDRKCTAQEIQAMHNEATKQRSVYIPYKQRDMVTGDRKFHLDVGKARVTINNVTAGKLLDTPYTVESGTFRIIDDTVQGRWGKCIECVADGELKIRAQAPVIPPGGELLIRRDAATYSVMRDAAAIRTATLKAGDRIAFAAHVPTRMYYQQRKYWTWKSTDTDAEVEVLALAGTPYWIDWGDGTLESFAGTGGLASHTKSYGSAGDRTLSFLCESPGDLLRFYADSQDIEGTIPDLSGFVNLQRLYFYSNNISGTIPDLSSCTSLQRLQLYSNNIEGPIPDLSSCMGLQYLFLNITNISGTIPDLSACTSLRYLYLYNTNLTGYTRSTISTACIQCQVNGCQLDVDAVNGILQDFTANAAARPGGGTILLNGGTNAAPDAGILAAAETALITDKPGDPWTISTN